MVISHPRHTKCFHDCIVFMIAYILHPSCLCEIWVLCVLWITYDHFYYAPCLACSSIFVLSCQQCVHHVSKCMSCHELIVMINGKPYCFEDYIYITPILWDLSTVILWHSYIRNFYMQAYINIHLNLNKYKYTVS